MAKGINDDLLKPFADLEQSELNYLYRPRKINAIHYKKFNMNLV